MNYVESLPISNVERGFADDRACDMLRNWILSRSELDGPQSLTSHSDHLLLFSGEIPDEDSPEILFVGRKTLLGKLLPETVSSEHNLAKALIDRGFRENVRDGYEEAISGEPVYQVISTSSGLPNGIQSLTYERILLPWKIRTGLTQLTAYVILRETSPRMNRPNLTPTRAY